MGLTRGWRGWRLAQDVVTRGRVGQGKYHWAFLKKGEPLRIKGTSSYGGHPFCSGMEPAMEQEGNMVRHPSTSLGVMESHVSLPCSFV